MTRGIASQVMIGRLCPLDPGGTLLGVQPRAKVLGGAEPVDGPVLARGHVLGPEHLYTRVTPGTASHPR